METIEKKPVGRPTIPSGQRKHKQAASITDDTLIQARKYFGTLGAAIEFAVAHKNNSRSGGLSPTILKEKK